MGKNDDIINHPHHVSKKYKHMSMEQRAVQFAPFFALSGFSENIDTADRYAALKAELSDKQKLETDSALGTVTKNILNVMEEIASQNAEQSENNDNASNRIRRTEAGRKSALEKNPLLYEPCGRSQWCII